MASSRSMAVAVQLCLALGLVALFCTAAEARKVNLGQEQAGPNFVCDACLQFSTEVQLILSDPDTQKQAADLLSQMTCQSLTPKLKAKCLDLVNVYVVDAFSILQLYLGPEICSETGLCLPEATRHISPRGKTLDEVQWSNAKTCAVCQEFASDALSYLAANTTKLKIIEALHLACARLEGISKQCDLVVSIYAPELIEHLEHTTPEEACQITHLCKGSGKPALASLGVKRNDCAICQFMVLEIKLKLRDPLTQERLLEVLLNGCDRVQNHVDECKMIVAQYAPFILANLDNILDADALCSRLGVCKAQKRNIDQSVLVLPSEGHVFDPVHSL